MQPLDDAGLRGQDRRAAPARRRRRDRRRRPARGLRRGAARPRAGGSGMRHFDVQLIGGMVLHEGKIAEMATGEGKTLVATLPAYLNALTGQGRPHRHRQRLPGPARRPVDGAALPVLGLTVGRHPARGLVPLRSGLRHVRHPADGAQADRAARGLSLRHHLRHEQRVRLRLPARQHEVLARGAGPARAALRHRRRGRLDPHRRGAHPAHHLGAAEESHRPVLQDRPDHPQAEAGGHDHGGQALRDRGPQPATSSSTRSRRRCR